LDKATHHYRVESLNIWTHGFGVFFFLFASVYMLTKASVSNQDFAFISTIIFALSLVILYSASTIYHWARRQFHPKTESFRLIDHIAIYYLIAGSYTPFTLIILVDGSGWRIFFSVWIIAFLGTIYKLLVHNRIPMLSLVFYIAMGGIVIFDIHELISSTDSFTLKLIAGGGLSYIIGTVFYAVKSIPYGHPIWHVFVLIGSGLHFVAVCMIV